MKKDELIAAVAKDAGITKDQAKKAVESTFDNVLAATLGGESVNVIGFGTFDLKTAEARKGRNPITGADIQIAAKKTLRFKFSKTTSDKINGK